MSRPKVLQVCVFGGAGGVEHHVLALSRNLNSVAEVVVVAPEGSWLAGEARTAGLEVRVVPEPRSNFDTHTLSALRRAIRAEEPDIVHSHLGRSDWYTWLAVTGRPSLTLVSTEHGISEHRQDLYVKGLRRRLHEFAHSMRLRRTDALIAVSSSTARTLRSRYPVLSGTRIAVISPGIADERLFEIRRQPSAIGAPLRVVCVGRLAEEKAVDVALRAFALLRVRDVQATLTVVGSGPEGARLAELARTLGLSDEVSFTGHLDDVIDALVEADVFLMTSRSENLPIALLEGMASGLPVVSTSVGGIPEVVHEGTTGKLVPVEDPEATALALEELAAHRDACRVMGVSARELARAYDMGHTVRAMGRVYESLG